uniref:Uncharacterized protein n=1 Tax=Aegilops tauschii subsp. strangulata TaxID=200361 RepID=A0A453NNN8_AEGTS
MRPFLLYISVQSSMEKYYFFEGAMEKYLIDSFVRLFCSFTIDPSHVISTLSDGASSSATGGRTSPPPYDASRPHPAERRGGACLQPPSDPAASTSCTSPRRPQPRRGDSLDTSSCGFLHRYSNGE